MWAKLIVIDIAPRIYLILLHVSKITHIYFSFFIRVRWCLFFSHGSSLIGLPFSPSFVVYCVRSCEGSSDLVYIDVCSNLVFGGMCSILLPIMRSDIFGSLSFLITAGDGRVLMIFHHLYHRWTSWRTKVIVSFWHYFVYWRLNIIAIKTLQSCFLPCDCHSSQKSGFSQHALAQKNMFPQYQSTTK